LYKFLIIKSLSFSSEVLDKSVLLWCPVLMVYVPVLNQA